MVDWDFVWTIKLFYHFCITRKFQILKSVSKMRFWWKMSKFGKLYDKVPIRGCVIHILRTYQSSEIRRKSTDLYSRKWLTCLPFYNFHLCKSSRKHLTFSRQITNHGLKTEVAVILVWRIHVIFKRRSRQNISRTKHWSN